jgi:hypothetical protein
LRNRKRVLWIMLAVLVALAGWVVNVELTYERNVRNMPAAFQLHRHIITRLWKA